MKKKVLIVTRNLPPILGGMERLNWHMAEELARYAEVQIVGPESSREKAPIGVQVVGAHLKPLPRFLVEAQWKAISVARHWRPDWILAGSGLMAPAVWSAAKLSGAMPAAYVHGLDVAVPHRAYRWLWLPALRRMHRIIANSRATAQLAQDVGCDTQRIGIVHPGVSLPHQLPAEHVLQQFRNEHGFLSRRLLLSVGRLTQRKGLREFVANCLPSIVERCPDTLLVIVGDVPTHALHAEGQSRESIQLAAETAAVGKNVCFMGVITDNEKVALYAAAHVHVFPVLHIPGDPEGFGMVATEAAAYGLPTVAFATGGVCDAVANGESGYLVAPGNYKMLADRIVQVLDEQGAMSENCRSFAERFEWPRFGRQICEQLSIPASLSTS
jgi:phosphatidyl-myo-inositol dimannoside synthase